MKIEAIILAGGKGTRLQTVVADRPKVMAVVKERPFLTHLLDQLESSGISSVVLSTGYKADQVEAGIGDSYGRMRIRYSREARPLGTAGGLRLAIEQTGSDSVLVLNGDSYCAVDLEKLCQFHSAVEARATIALTQVDDTSRFGRVETNAESAVTKFEEKGGAKIPGWINAGIYCLDRKVIEQLPPGEEKSLERDVFPKLIGDGLYGFRGGGRFIDIGTPQSYEEAQSFFRHIQSEAAATNATV